MGIGSDSLAFDVSEPICSALCAYRIVTALCRQFDWRKGYRLALTYSTIPNRRHGCFASHREIRYLFETMQSSLCSFCRLVRRRQRRAARVSARCRQEVCARGPRVVGHRVRAPKRARRVRLRRPLHAIRSRRRLRGREHFA